MFCRYCEEEVKEEELILGNGSIIPSCPICGMFIVEAE